MLISSVKSTRRLTYHQFFLTILKFEFSPIEQSLSGVLDKSVDDPDNSVCSFGWSDNSIG